MKLIRTGLCFSALFLTAVSTGGEVEDGDVWNCGGTDVTANVDANATANDVDYRGDAGGSTGSTATGTPGSNSTVANPTCEESGASGVDHDGDPETPAMQTRCHNGKVQYRNEAGDWVNGKRKKKPKRAPDISVGTSAAVTAATPPPTPSPGEDITSLPGPPDEEHPKTP